ncbi:MAG: hypothetical protein GF315_11515 [candidate division Zixibacteria bacterium]|nr:hypothetical protein [candidate division Zixibacteria bacterium]
MRGNVTGVVGITVTICLLLSPSTFAFEPGTFDFGIGGGFNVPLLDFSDQYTLAAAVGWSGGAQIEYQVAEKFALAAHYNFRWFDTHFVSPPTGYTGGYAEYRIHSVSLAPRIYISDEAPSSFVEVGASGFLPYFYIPGDPSAPNILPEEWAPGVNFGFGWHTGKADLLLRYNIYNTSEEYFIHYITFDVMFSLLSTE